jgi:anaphase-promoting complex subunit 1
MKSGSTNSKNAAPAQPSLQHTRFGQDRRVAEVERIMEIYNVRTVSVPDPEGASEQDIVLFHQSVVNVLSNRTLSATVGRGILDYGRRRTAVIDPIRIPMIELSVKVVPGNSLVKAQINAENADWPCFHNGVSAALALSRDCKGITSAWIHSNRPSTLNPEHGGFLLGLGLNGHLRSISSIHVLNYLEPRHDYVSSGLLLGWGGSFAGSRDELCTKVFSLHTHALLPLGSAELNASPVVQCSALVGLGLVHAGSRDLRMAEVTLSEVGRRRLAGLDTFEDHQEAYSFSASMAFVLIMLGRGGQQTSDVDRRLLAKLRRCIIGESVEGHQAPHAIDTTITAPGATLALGLMYLKTGDREARDMLEIPQTAFDADHVRPDFLLLRVLARSLIMWDDINPSMTWIEGQLPPFIRAAREAQKKHTRMPITSELAYFYMVAGACFAIGLKYAGTASELAHNNLIAVFSELSKAASASSFAYEFQIRRHAARQCLNVVTLALAAVMSGTGELHVMRRLRVSHGQEGNGVTYGTHMANHMATGLLFLGRGHYTLGNSNVAIAALCISFFPRFQPNPSDNKAYPQSFRHLWALAVEPRCLVAKDVDTKRTVYLPIGIKVKEGDQIRSQMLISPTLVTPFTSVVSIEVDSPRYWPIVYDLSNAKDRDSLVKTRTMHVKRKAAFLDYKDDPKGHRSMLTRAGSMTGWDLYHDLLSPAAPPTVSAAELESLVTAHAPLPELIAMTRLHTGDGAFDVFVRNVILECVSMDKVHLLQVYMSMWLALHGQEDLRIEHIAQYNMLETFYSPSVYPNFMLLSTSADRKQGWIRPSFLQLATRRIQEIKEGDIDLGDYFIHEIWSSAIAIYIARNNVPSLEFLRALRLLVVKSREAPIEVLEIRVRDAARKYAQGLQRQYDPTDVDQTVDVKVWKLDSIRKVVELWLKLPTE